MIFTRATYFSRRVRIRRLGGALYLWLLVGFVLLGALGGPAAASAAGQPPATAPMIDRDRADRVVPELIEAPPPPPGKASPPDMAVRPASEVALAGFRYEGATLPGDLLDRALHPFLGRPLTADTLRAVAGAVGGVYAASDIAYYAVSIPAQVPAGGILTVRIVEGRVAEFRLRDPTRSTPTRLIAAHMHRLMRERPLRKRSLERALSLLRDIPGQSLEAKVRALNSAGDLALDLNVRRRQLQFDLTVDNGGVSNVVDGVQAQLAVTANGLLREGDSTRVAAYLPFHPDRYRFYSAGHTTPLGSNGASLTASFAHLRTRTRQSDIVGRATLAGLSANVPVIRSYRRNLSLSLSLDGVDSSNYYLDIRFGDYRSRALRLGASWSEADERTGYAASAVLSRGLDMFGARPFAGFSDVRFTKFNFQGVAAHSLYRKVVAKLTVKGQYSRSRLPVTERFSLGGSGAGLAFRTGEVTADRGLAGSLELSWQLPTKPRKPALTLFAYADGGLGQALARPVYNLPAKDYALASAGGGIRVAFGRWHARAELAVPLDRPRPDYRNSPRLLFAVGRSL